MEPVKDRLNCNRGIETGEVKYGVGDGGSIGFEGLQNEEEAFFISGDKSSKRGYILKRKVVFDVGKLKSADKGGQTLSTESKC